MPVEEKRVRLTVCKEGKRALDSFLKSIDAYNKNCAVVLCLFSGEKMKVYCAQQSLAQLAMTLQDSGEIIYHVGMLAGSLNERGGFLPSLELGWELIKANTISGRNVVVLEGDEAKEFIFGRTVELVSEMNWEEEGKTVAVINEQGEFLGWGKIRGKRLIPVVDIGSYVRYKD
jgi:ribosome biogenesis protein Nip4